MKINEFVKLTKEERKKVPFKQLPWPNKYIPIFVILLIVISIGQCIHESGSSAKAEKAKGIDTLTLEITAKVLNESAVKQLLKSPSSAEFPAEEQKYWMLADSTVVVKGAVDAQNTFGAMLRTTFYTKLKWNGDYKDPSNWTVIESHLEE
ncbi:MAG: hypothetical protein WCR72_13510 [Bacteroidota bacterium]